MFYTGVSLSVQGKAITFLAAGISRHNFPQKERKSKFLTFRDKIRVLMFCDKQKQLVHIMMDIFMHLSTFIEKSEES